MINTDIVQKLWGLCDVLRDDGINYSDYVTELALLLFIKMEYEQVQNNASFEHKLPDGCRWSDLISMTGVSRLNHYRQILQNLGKSNDPIVAAIYIGSQTRIKEPYHFDQLIKTLDSINWFDARKDGLGDLYEGLLEKNASETKSGAGQYFTKRSLIDSIVRVIQPQAGEIIQDPAAGTAGFLIAADTYIKQHTNNHSDLDDEAQCFQRNLAFVGVELVPETRRLALMNCILHGIEGGAEGVVRLGNTLGQTGVDLPKADLILSNPPFGTAKGGGGPTRSDLSYKTSNKQLAFIQHIYQSLKPGGRAAVILPDNVLFETGIGTEVRRELMDKCNLHTVLRLPTGIFYAHGVKTNVLFFQKGSPKDPNQKHSCTQRTWFYDLRTNMPNFGKRNQFGTAHLKSFESAYGNDPNGNSPRTENVEGIGETSRFRVFTRQEIRNCGDSLDITWLRETGSLEEGEIPLPSVLAGLAIAELSEALLGLEQLKQALGSEDE
ncbi:TPA: N-6 DNA methylase [Pseudomonas aeruginosa]